jgi:hypothetical protein
MSRMKVSIGFSLAFLLVLGIALLSFEGWSAEAARLTVRMDQDETTASQTPLEAFTPTPTPTPITGILPPDFPVCPAGFEILGTFDDYIRRDIEPKSHSYPFSLSEGGVILLQGWVMEGHPDQGCPGDPSCDQIQDHEDIIFEIDGEILGIYEDSEHGPYENAWYFFGPMFADLATGTHTLTFRHTLHGEDAQSVGYRFSLCVPVEASPTPTHSPEITPTFTPSPSPSPTDQPSLTPTAESTPTPTNTPPPLSGLVIFGSVQVDDTAHDMSKEGLAGVNIYLAFASYPGRIVAVTDGEGRYQSDFIQIPVDETIRVWAIKDDYRFEPELEMWRFYAGHYQERQIDFLAYPDIVTVTPITPTFTPTFTPAPSNTPAPIKTSCIPQSGPRTPEGYVLFEEVGKIYATEGILNFQAGTVSTWVCLEPNHFRSDHVIFHTSDSRIVLYFDTYFSSSWEVEISRFVARAGGTHRAVDSGYALGNFPEASIIIDNDGSLREYGATTEWYSPTPFQQDEWHLVTMTWDGYPRGVVKIFLDGNLIGKKPYDERYNDERPLADSLAIGIRPSHWIGEIYVPGNQQVQGSVPSGGMTLWDGGIQIFDLRLYKRSLSQGEILSIFLEGLPNP